MIKRTNRPAIIDEINIKFLDIVDSSKLVCIIECCCCCCLSVSKL